MSLFCRSSNVVSGEMSLGTAFRPGGITITDVSPGHNPEKLRVWGHRHTDMHPGTLLQPGRSSGVGRSRLFSLPIRLQPDNWMLSHTEIRIPKPAQGHPISAPLLLCPPIPQDRHMCPLDMGTQAVPVLPHTPPTTAPGLTQVRALDNPQVAVAAKRTHGTEGGREGVQVRDS